MALINVGGIGPLQVTRYVLPDKHVFEWTWRGDYYYLDNHQPIAFRNGSRISDDEYYGRGSFSNAFNQMRQAILAADGRGEFDGDDSATVPPPDDGDDDMPDDPGMYMPGPAPIPPFPGDPGDGQVGEGNVVMASALATPIIAVLRSIAAAGSRVLPRLVQGVRIRWNTIPGWLQQVLINLGFVAGYDIIWDIDDSGSGGGGGGLPFFGGGSEDPTTAMVEAMTVSTWNANGVQFHRLSDGRLAVQNKHGVWKVWRPKKPIVIMPTGQADLKDLVRADNAIQKQAKRLAKMLRGRGYNVSRK